MIAHWLFSLAKEARHRLLSARQYSAMPSETCDSGSWNPVGMWAPRYQSWAAGVRSPDGERNIIQYGRIASYQLGALFLEECAEVEDWGCGYGTFKRFCLSPRYIGIDGSESPGANVIRDLRSYTSDVQGIFVRHVLEHNPTGWRQILLNAIQSFSKRMVLVIYTPFGNVTRNVRKFGPDDIRVPVALSFRTEDITSCFPPKVSWFAIVGEPLDEYETVFFLKKGVKQQHRDQAKQAVCYVPDFNGDL